MAGYLKKIALTNSPVSAIFTNLPQMKKNPAA
jgi:hypothetical protein